MRQEPVAYRDVYQQGDKVLFVRNEERGRFGDGTFEVKGHEGGEVVVVVHLLVRVPEDAVLLHQNRPHWMEPGYVKGE